jgi:hypothetical protein
MEQRANIKFSFKKGKTDIETFQLIKQAYGDNVLSLSLSLSRTRDFEWYARFLDGRENLEGDESSGRPTAVRAPDMMETVRELTASDRRMTLWMEEELEVSREIINKILVDDLGKRNICLGLFRTV